MVTWWSGSLVAEYVVGLVAYGPHHVVWREGFLFLYHRVVLVQRVLDCTYDDRGDGKGKTFSLLDRGFLLLYLDPTISLLSQEWSRLICTYHFSSGVEEWSRLSGVLC